MLFTQNRSKVLRIEPGFESRQSKVFLCKKTTRLLISTLEQPSSVLGRRHHGRII